MTPFQKRLADTGRAATRAAVKELETRILVAEGKRSVERKVRTVKKVGKKAAKTGLIAGTLAAAAVVIHEAKKRRV